MLIEKKIFREEDLNYKDIPFEEITRVPDCKKTFPLDFSMYTFEHLNVSCKLIYIFFYLRKN